MFENDYDFQQLTKAIRAGLVQPERSGEYWGEDEREKLKELFNEGIDISRIALELQRSEMAVIQQLIMGKFLTSPGTSRPRKPKPPRCLCQECRLGEYHNSCPLRKEASYAGEL